MTKALFEITVTIAPEQRVAVGRVCEVSRALFLDHFGAQSKTLLVRPEDVQVLQGFYARANADCYLQRSLFQQDLVTALKPYLRADPEIRIYEWALGDSIRYDLLGIALEPRLDPSSRCPSDRCLLDRMRR